GAPGFRPSARRHTPSLIRAAATGEDPGARPADLELRGVTGDGDLVQIYLRWLTARKAGVCTKSHADCDLPRFLRRTGVGPIIRRFRPTSKRKCGLILFLRCITSWHALEQSRNLVGVNRTPRRRLLQKVDQRPLRRQQDIVDFVSVQDLERMIIGGNSEIVVKNSVVYEDVR